MLTTIEEEKLAFIDDTNTTIDALVEPILKERMKGYSEQFGAFSRLDVRLWSSCSIAFDVAFHASREMDAKVD